MTRTLPSFFLNFLYYTTILRRGHGVLSGVWELLLTAPGIRDCPGVLVHLDGLQQSTHYETSSYNSLQVQCKDMMNRSV